MVEKKTNNTEDSVMTEERLRKHLFGGPQVPFWNYDPEQITIGVEIEYFIARVHTDGRFTLATKSEYLSVIENLKRSHSYVDRNLLGQPGRVSKDTECGFITIKPDFAWHILEISFPPRKSIDDLRRLLNNVFSEVDLALSAVGLERLDISVLPNVPEKMELVELDRLHGHIDVLKKQGNLDDFCVPFFPALIAATHIHINCFNEESMPVLPYLYAVEPAIMEKFSRANGFRSNLHKNARTALYESTLGKDYCLRTIPKQVPTGLNELAIAYNSSTKLFPNDSFFPVRDMSYIRPSKYGTLEFRSACSYRDIDTVLRIAQSRTKQLIMAQAMKDIGLEERQKLIAIFSRSTDLSLKDPPKECYPSDSADAG